MSHSLNHIRKHPARGAVFAILIAGSLGAVGCGGAKAGSGADAEHKAPQSGQAHGQAVHRPPTAPNARATRVEVARLEPSDANLSTTIPGEVIGSRDAVLASALGGPVERLAVEEGDTVKRGQLIVEVDTDLYEIRLRQAETRLRSAERAFKRSKGLGSALAEAERDRRQDDFDAAKDEVALAKLQLARSRITAPFPGVVTKLHVEVGEVVGATSPLADLVQLDPVHVELSVPDRDVVALAKGDKVQVHVSALPRAQEGTIAQIAVTSDQNTRAFEAKVTVPNSNFQLRPGMIGSVSVNRTVAEGAVVIPQDWLVTRRDGVGVFLDDKGVAKFVPVKPGRIVRDQVVVDEGLEQGMRLVIRGHRSLADGDPLSIAREGVCCTAGRARFEEL